jgi:regulator of sigma E protease
VAAESALQRGDVIERVNGVAVGTWDQVLEQVGRASGADEITLNLARDGRTVVRKLSSSDVLHAISTRKEGAGLQRIGIEPMGIRVVAGPVTTFGPAGRAGLKEKDEILAIDSTPMFSPIQLTKYVRSHAGQQITLHVERETGTMPIPVTVGKDSLIQFVPIMKYIGPERYREFGVVESAGLAIDEIWSTSENIVVSVANVIQGKLAFSQSFGGPKRIAEMSAQAFSISIEVSLRLLALISISLAVLNLLPLPGLDGGHLVFVGVEAILRREIPTQIKIRIQQVGVFLLIGLMLLVIYFDFTR